MATPAVFISHSTVRETEDPYLSAVVAALKEEDRYRVLLDREGLRPSDDWALKIVNWLASCHAAVIILSERALTSDYVKFEVGNLFARWYRKQRAPENQSEFVMCVVVPHEIDQVARANSYYNAIGISQQQRILAASPEDAVRQVLDRLEPLRQRVELPPTPIDSLLLRIEVLLCGLDARLLRLGLTALRLNPGDANELPRQLAEGLIFSPLARSIAALQAMQPMPKQSAWDLYQLIAPSWVGPEAALELRARLETASDRAVHVTLNADHPEFTPAMYLQRATGNLLDASGQVIGLTTLSGRRGITEEALAHDIDVQLLEKVVGADADPDDPDDVQELQRSLRFEQMASRSVIVALKLGAERLRGLRRAIATDRYPGVAFLALCASADENEEHDFLLRPELQAGQEEAAYRNCVQAETIMMRLKNG